MAIVVTISAPFTGWLLDKNNHYTEIDACIVAGLLAFIGYLSIGVRLYSSTLSILAMLLLSISQALMSTVTLSCIGKYLPVHLLTVGFSMIEVFDSILYLTGNYTFGYLYLKTGEYIDSLYFMLMLSVLGVVLCVTIRFIFAEQLFYSRSSRSNSSNTSTNTAVTYLLNEATGEHRKAYSSI